MNGSVIGADDQRCFNRRLIHDTHVYLRVNELVYSKLCVFVRLSQLHFTLEYGNVAKMLTFNCSKSK